METLLAWTNAERANQSVAWRSVSVYMSPRTAGAGPWEDVTIIRTPVQAPNANGVAERWIRSVREECLDRMLMRGERQLQRVLAAYVDYYNHARPHQGIDQQCPVRVVCSGVRDGPLERRDILGGM